MASNSRRKSASSDSNRRRARRAAAPGSRQGSQRAGEGQWHAVAGGRYSAPERQQAPKLTSVRVGDLDRLERQTRAQARYRRYLVRLTVIVSIVAALVIGAVLVYNSSLFTITLLRVDAAGIENRLKQDAWVQDVTVNRVFPDTLELVVTERQIAAVVEVPTSDGKGVQPWAIASDHMWLMPIPDRDSEAGQRTSAKVYEDADAALHIKDVPFGTKAQVGTYCSDDSVLNALDILSGMTTELAGRVKTVYADGVEETRLILDNNVEIAFGSADNIRDKERIVLGIMEQHPDAVAYINVRDVNSPTYRAL